MRGEHISFYVVFVAAVYREIITIGVDYTQILKKKDCEREKEKCMFYITCGPTTQREREKFCVRKLNFKIFEVCHNEFFARTT